MSMYRCLVHSFSLCYFGLRRRVRIAVDGGSCQRSSLRVKYLDMYKTSLTMYIYVTRLRNKHKLLYKISRKVYL